MHQYNCILQQRRGGMENKSSLGGAARWNHFEIFGMKIYFVQEVTRPILVFYSHTCCWLFLPSHFSSLLPFPLLFWKTFNLLCFCPFIPMLHNLSFYNINHFYLKTFYFRSLVYILLPSHLPFHFHFHKCQDLSHFTILFLSGWCCLSSFAFSSPLSLSQLSRSFPLYKSFFSGRCCLSSLAFPPPPFCSSSSPSPLHTGSPSGYQVISCIYMEVILAVTYD